MYKLTNISYKSGNGPKEFIVAELDYAKYKEVTFLNKENEIQKVNLNLIIYLIIKEKFDAEIERCDIEDLSNK